MDIAVHLSSLQKSSLAVAFTPSPKSLSLVERCLAGETKAQFELYQQYAKAMYNCCLRIINHEIEAEDVLQEAFLLAFRRLTEYRKEAEFGAWLKRIVVNTAINHIRKRRLDLLPIESARGQLDDNEMDKQRDTELVYEIERVKRAILNLPDGFRVVLTLYLLEGYDHVEIAEILGISESTSKSQYNRAKAKLREILKGAGNTH